MRKAFLFLGLVAVFLVMGLIGGDDYENEVATYKQTVEIKESMRQLHRQEERDAEAYRQLFIHRDD